MTELNQTQNQEQKQKKSKISKTKLFTLISAGFLVLAHIAIVLAIILSFRYYAIYPSLFGSIVAIIVCLLVIVDILFFIGFNHEDLALKIIATTVAVFMLLGGTVGSYYVARANGIVNSVLNPNASRYEVFSGKFVYNSKSDNNFSSITDLNNKIIGFVAESSDGIQYIAKEELKKAKVEYNAVEYNTNAEVIQGLLDGTVDAIVITSAYRDIYSAERDENSPFAKYLDNFIDFYSFEKEMKVDTGKKTKNISKEPFNVLLIGYSRTELGSTVGLADSIILASINPQTYTVSMMSIARDSFVPIACYGGEYDKINSGRSTSRACFIETVENFIGQDIDYYMELDYLGLVAIVNAIGGIYVNNPVDFELDGTFVPAGDNVFCDGIMALQFCRERHHMPNGDFDRQQHQKEVIIKIAEKFIQSKDINLALRAMDDASEWMSTDMSLDQLTQIFNLLLNTKNYTSLDTFDLVDFQTLRMTGSGGLMYYSYSMNLPLWVYLIYQGSYDESMYHMKEVLGQYSVVNQNNNFEFSTRNPYERPLFYSLEYEDKFMYSPDPMPPYWADLEGLTVAEAMAWASANGVTLTVGETILAGDSRYDQSLEGLVSGQSVRYGALVSENKVGTITVMGSGDIDLDDYYVPDFVGKDVSKVFEWANKHDITVTGNDGITSGRVVKSQTPEAGTPIKDVEKIKVELKEPSKYTVSFNSDGGDTCASITVTQGLTYGPLPSPTKSEKIFGGWYTEKGGKGTKITSDSDVTITSDITLYAYWKDIVYITLDANGGTVTPTSVATTGSLPDAAYSGKVFLGWFTEATGGSEVTDISGYTSATTLYAHWHTHNYSIDIPAITADCETEGFTAGKKCECGEIDPANTPTSTGYKTEGCTPAIEYPYDEPCDAVETCTGYVAGATMSCTLTHTSETESSCSCTVLDTTE